MVFDMAILLSAPVRPVTTVEAPKPSKRNPLCTIAEQEVSKGRWAEKRFNLLLQDQQWFKVVEDYPDPEYMFELAAQYHAAKLNSLMENSGGSLTSLEALGAKALMDMIFKVDFLLEYIDKAGYPVRVSIDLTSNTKEVKQKEIEIIRKEATLHKLGVDRACVVLWNIKPGQPPYTKEPLLQTIRDRLVSNKYFCNTVILF
jgi:hypothetical protein